jgi:hypothetical protein
VAGLMMCRQSRSGDQAGSAGARNAPLALVGVFQTVCLRWLTARLTDVAWDTAMACTVGGHGHRLGSQDAVFAGGARSGVALIGTGR